MKKEDAIQKINEGLSEILKETYALCDSDNSKESSLAIKINQKTHEIKLILEKYCK